jgi:hypothetical protein
MARFNGMRLSTPALLASVLAFVFVAVLQLSNALPGAERGLLLFEKACPIYSSAR